MKRLQIVLLFLIAHTSWAADFSVDEALPPVLSEQLTLTAFNSDDDLTFRPDTGIIGPISTSAVEAFVANYLCERDGFWGLSDERVVEIKRALIDLFRGEFEIALPTVDGNPSFKIVGVPPGERRTINDAVGILWIIRTDRFRYYILATGQIIRHQASGYFSDER